MKGRKRHIWVDTIFCLVGSLSSLEQGLWTIAWNQWRHALSGIHSSPAQTSCACSL